MLMIEQSAADEQDLAVSGESVGEQRGAETLEAAERPLLPYPDEAEAVEADGGEEGWSGVISQIKLG
jgi:hypothetical protein